MLQGWLQEAFFPFASEQERVAFVDKQPHPDVPITYWADELGHDEKERMVIRRTARRQDGMANLSDWGRAMVAAFKFIDGSPSAAAAATAAGVPDGGGDGSGKESDAAAASTSADARDSADEVLRRTLEARAGLADAEDIKQQAIVNATMAAGKSNFDNPEDEPIMTGGEAAAIEDQAEEAAGALMQDSGGPAQAARIAAAMSDAALQEQVRTV